MKTLTYLRFIFSLFLLMAGGASAAIRMPAFFSDNMVLQQQTEVAVWGWAAPGERVRIRVGWDRQEKLVTADGAGNWKVRLRTAKAGGPYTIQVEGNERATGAGIPEGDREITVITIRNVWLGEVWLCSGQSNMNFPIAKLASWRTGIFNADSVIAASADSLLRMFTVEQASSFTPRQDVKGSWKVSGPAASGNFSAVAYFFARAIRRETGMAVGIIHSSVGGTAAESWVSGTVLQSDTAFAGILTQYEKAVKTDSAGTHSTKAPTALYNAMIHPLAPYTVRGVCWYQGESNSDRASQYRKLFPDLIASWRSEWGAELPFYFVQIAPQHTKVPEIREAQLLTYRAVPNTGMVVLTDAGDSLDIHPRNKLVVGERLALWALAGVYGKKKLVCSGPLYRDMQVEGDRIRIRFDFTGGGLVAADGPLTEFVIAGADGHFVPARAVIDRQSVLVSAEGIGHPVAVRFAWKNFPRPNLFNKEGLPASPFRTDGGK